MTRAAVFPEAYPFEQVLHQRLLWMVRLRWLAGMGILLTVILADRITDVRYYKFPLYMIVVFILLYNLGLEYWLGRMGRTQARDRLLFFANLQIGLDFVVLLLLVTFAGGVQNLFVFYVIFHIVIGSILLPRRNMMIVTVMICLLCTGLFWADYLGYIPDQYRLHGFLPDTAHHSRTFVFGLSYIFVTTVAVTAYMAITISKNLRDAERRLLTMTREIEHRRLSCEEQKQEIQEQAEDKSEFINMATLQLKAPISEIHAIVSDLLAGDHDRVSPSTREKLEMVARDGEILHDLVEDMQEMDRLRDLEGAMPREEVDLGAVARASVARMSDLAREKDVNLKAEVSVELPLIHGDAGAWRQVFDNLIENAILYSKPGREVEFRLERDWQGEWIKALVKDCGVGMKQEELAKIFDPFYRSPAARSTGPGTGMGLSIVKKVVELHGGSVDVISRPGQGSTFRLSVPVKGKG